MIKRILVPLDLSVYSNNALTEAIYLAKNFNAEITGVVVLDIESIERSIGAVPLGGSFYAKVLEKERIKEAELHINELLEKFKSRCDAEGVRHHELHTQGIPSIKVLEESVFYDILIIGLRTFYHFEREEDIGDSFEKIIYNSITPIIAVPKELHHKKNFIDGEPMKTLIAFNGSQQSCRAMQRFVQLTSDFKMYEDNIHIVCSHEDNKVSKYYLDRAEEYLNAYSLKNITKVATDNNIISFIDKNYKDWPDYIVMGVHIKHGIFEFAIGSLLKYLVKDCKTTLFISQ
jgi:nucleotide-binding universal stress UspA family protein